jgi:predicted metalloprotease
MEVAMLWNGGRRSTNVEDRRGMRLGPSLIGGGLGSIVLVLIGLFMGIDPRTILNNSPDEAAVTSAPSNDDTKDFIETVVGYTEDTWTDIFRREGRQYQPPKLILFTRAVDSACGFGQAAMGPFYCPRDQSVYLDTSFFQELRDRFHAPGEFAQAYVISHEIGHHVQKLLHISDQVEAFQDRSNKTEANQESVGLELQADCFAGVWATNTQKREQSQGHGFLESGDVEEALLAASMIGDDKLQMQDQGYIVPESFTHGTADQRMRWFKRGFDSGTISGCNTFQ